MILVTGATGKIGQALCELLTAAKVPMRAMCRKEEQVVQLSAAGIAAVWADFENLASLREALHGCEKLFLVTPPVPAQRDWELRLVDVALEQGVQHIVHLSAADVNLGSPVPWARSHAEVEHYLRSKPVAQTILRPTGFMQNFLESARAIAQGVLPHVTGAGRVSYIDARDVAAVALRVLSEDGHDRATYYLTGPEALAVEDIASQLTAALGRVVRPIELTADAMVETLRKAGISAWFIDGMMAQFAVIAGGYTTDVTEEVQRLTGAKPRTFLEFAQASRAAFG